MQRPASITGHEPAPAGAISVFARGEWNLAAAPHTCDAGSAYRIAGAAIQLSWLATVTLAIALVIGRRLAGALEQPLSWSATLLAGGILAVWAVAAHHWLHQRISSAPPWRSLSVWLPPAVLLVAAWALIVPGTSAVAASGLVALVGAGELAAWILLWRRERTAVVLRTTLPVGSQTASDETEEAAIIPEDAAEGVLSELVRERGADGVETIRGWLLAEFAAGQRTAVAHVAFCPALGGQPQCEAEQVAGPSATVRVAQILPLGARIEARLDAPAQAATAVRIELAASGAAAADPND